MKLKSLIGSMGLLRACAAFAQPADTWVNWQVINAPPDLPPQIDALNFVNSNSMTIVFTNFTVNPELFDTSDTLNFTNVGFMSAAAGWQFDTAPAVSGFRRPANSIYNSGSIFAGSSTLISSLFGDVGNVIFGFNFFGGAKIIGSADTIVNTGTMEAGPDGIIKLNGGTLSLSRGELNLEGTGSGIFDGYWGARTNVLNPAQSFNDLFVFTPVHTVTQLVDHAYQTLGQSLFFTNFTTWVDRSITGPTSEVVRIVILNQQNPAISNNVYLPTAFGGGLLFGDIEMEWIAYATNPVTGDIITNYISLVDSYLDPPTTNNFTQTNHIFSGNLDTQIPTNFFIAFGGPIFGTNFSTPSPIGGIFDSDLTQQVTNQYAAYEAQILPFTQLTNDMAGRSITNLAGRVELTASRVLDLNRTRAFNPNVMMLQATNHFAGNDAAQLSSAFWNLDLATTNSSIAISNLLMPLPRVTGFIDFYRARWTNQVVTAISTNTRVYHVLVVDSELSTVATPEVYDFLLKKTNNTDVVINDQIDVLRNFRINAQNLTIASNNIPDPPVYPIAFYPVGGINFLNTGTLWSTALPNLRNLTNFGLINVQNAAFFGGQRVSPFISSGPGDWYDSFINYGDVAAQGLTIYAKYLINSGSITTNNGIAVSATGLLDAGVGPLSISAVSAEITNGILVATNSSVSLGSSVLGVSNSLIFAGGPLTLSVSSQLDDGSLTNCVSAVSNKPIWICQGFDLPVMPSFASLFATTVTNSTAAYHQVINVWAGRDLGNTSAGFVNNAAVGRLVLDGGHPDSLFTFTPANGNNALYVDDLEFMNYATNVDAGGNYIGINIQPGMKIYYAEAKSYTGSNVTSIAEKLNGANNGRFVWVSNYNCGFFSSTNTSPQGVAYVDPVTGTPYTVNIGMALSKFIDSDGDMINNFYDNTPFGTNIPTCSCPALVVPAFLSGDNSSFVPGGGSSNSVAAEALTVQYPGTVAPDEVASYQTFTDVAGSYCGLFSDTNVLSAADSGYFTATTTSKGKITAKFVMGNRTYTFSKQLDANGRASGSINRMPLHALTVNLKVNLAGANEITGTVSDSRWISQLVAHRQVFDKTQNPATQFAGTYTLRIPGDQSNGHPAGDGFATVKIDASGGVQMSGALADGTKITQKSAISSAGYWPMYVPAYQGAGCAMGWLQLLNSRIAGAVFWLKPAGAIGGSAKAYSGGFTNRAAAAGLSYVAPNANEQPVSWNWGEIVLSGGGISGLWTNTFYLDLPGHNFVPANSTLKLGFTGSSGLFQGTVVDPNSNQQIKFQGVLFQDLNVGLGYFLNSGLSGQLYMGPTP